MIIEFSTWMCMCCTSLCQCCRQRFELRCEYRLNSCFVEGDKCPVCFRHIVIAIPATYKGLWHCTFPWIVFILVDLNLHDLYYKLLVINESYLCMQQAECSKFLDCKIPLYAIHWNSHPAMMISVLADHQKHLHIQTIAFDIAQPA